MGFRFWCLGFLLAVWSAPASRADVLLYDYVQTSLISFPTTTTAYNAEKFADNRTKIAQRFITQANGYVITQLKLNIWTGLQNPGTYTVDLYSDNSNAVGTKVATAGTRDIATIYAASGTLTQATFSNLNINLATNTSYWVVVESNTGVEGSGMYWGHGGSTNVTNPTSAARFNPATTPQWYTYPTASNPGALGMQVYASVPEPGTLLLGGLASLLGGGSLWRRRPRSTSTKAKSNQPHLQSIAKAPPSAISPIPPTGSTWPTCRWSSPCRRSSATGHGPPGPNSCSCSASPPSCCC